MSYSVQLCSITVEKETLNKISKGFDITVLNSLRIVTGMLKGPEAFPTFSLVISASISLAVVGKIRKLSHGGSFKYSKGDY